MEMHILCKGISIPMLFKEAYAIAHRYVVTTLSCNRKRVASDYSMVTQFHTILDLVKFIAQLFSLLPILCRYFSCQLLVYAFVGESPYKCTQCSRAFVRSTDLQRHLRNHTGEKPYKCAECMRAFARSTDLKRHFRTHTGEKPYKCWHCSKAFSQSGSLQTHLHTHYKEAIQKKDMATAERLKNSIRKKLINKVVTSTAL